MLEELGGKQFGKSPYQLSVAEAQVLAGLEPEPATINELEASVEESEPFLSRLFVDAVVEAQAEADSLSKKRTVEMTERAVCKRLDFLENRGVFGDDLTLDESVQVSRLEGHQDNAITAQLNFARDTALQKKCSSADCLKEIIDQLPTTNDEVDESPNPLRLDSEDDTFVEDDDDDDDLEDAFCDSSNEEYEDVTSSDALDQFDIELSGDLVALYGTEAFRSNECQTIHLLKSMIEWCENGQLFAGGIQLTFVRNDADAS